MAKWARIEGGVVREVIDFDPAGRFGPPLVFVPAPDDVVEGKLYDGQAFSNPPAPEVRQPSYRDLRAVAYRDELGDEKGDFIKTLGDVLDVLIKEQRARGAAVTPEATTLYGKVDAIKQRHPKP